jgi:hypothetical protein
VIDDQRYVQKHVNLIIEVDPAKKYCLGPSNVCWLRESDCRCSFSFVGVWILEDTRIPSVDMAKKEFSTWRL